MRIVVTGGSGRAGRYIIPELLQHGHQVVNADILRIDDPGVEFFFTDLTNYGQTVSVLHGADAVIHMAAIPNNRLFTPQVVFSTNVTSTFNVLHAAEVLGIPKLVLASSVNAMGNSLNRYIVPPLYFPVDEEHPTRAEDPYSLTKWLGEQTADAFARRRKVQIASFRFHGLREDDYLRHLRQNPVTDPVHEVKSFWGYLHLKDCARACRMALESTWEGHHGFFLNAADTILSIPTVEALDKCYPGVPLKEDLHDFTSPIDISQAKRVFIWEPEVSWRAE